VLKRKDIFLLTTILVIVLIGLSLWSSYFFIQKRQSVVISFKIDDIQDFWQSEKQRAIILLHINREVPIKIAVIADFFGEDELLKDLVKEGISIGIVNVQNHGLDVERIENKSFNEQFQIISNANDKIREQLGVVPHEFVPHELAYDENTIKAVEDLNMKLAVEEYYHVFVTGYSNDAWEYFDLEEILQSVHTKVQRYGRVEIYFHFQALTFEQYYLLFNALVEEYNL
jgi:hypothetical protein